MLLGSDFLYTHASPRNRLITIPIENITPRNEPIEFVGFLMSPLEFGSEGFSGMLPSLDGCDADVAGIVCCCESRVGSVNATGWTGVLMLLFADRLSVGEVLHCYLESDTRQRELLSWWNRWWVGRCIPGGEPGQVHLLAKD